MQPIWNGDRRDRVKWGAIYHLATQHNIRNIIWVLFHRDQTDQTLQTDNGAIPIPEPVWSHFSDLHRIRKLWDATERTLDIFDQPFDHPTRREYITSLIARLNQLPSRRLVFLDPDTGIEPGTATVQHVTEQDIGEIWNQLTVDDMLLVYQHADHTGTWLEQHRQQLSRACNGENVGAIRGQNIAGDVAILFATKAGVVKTKTFESL
jgi:hypothetical protein